MVRVAQVRRPAGEDEEAQVVVVEVFFDVAHHVWADEAADEVAHGVDEGDAGGGGGAAEEEAGEGPEWAESAPDSNGGDGEGGDDQWGCVEEGADAPGPVRTDEGGEEDDLAALAGAVGVAADDDHADDGAGEGDGVEQGGFGIGEAGHVP